MAHACTLLVVNAMCGEHKRCPRKGVWILCRTLTSCFLVWEKGRPPFVGFCVPFCLLIERTGIFVSLYWLFGLGLHVCCALSHRHIVVSALHFHAWCVSSHSLWCDIGGSWENENRIEVSRNCMCTSVTAVFVVTACTVVIVVATAFFFVFVIPPQLCQSVLLRLLLLLLLFLLLLFVVLLLLLLLLLFFFLFSFSLFPPKRANTTNLLLLTLICLCC